MLQKKNNSNDKTNDLVVDRENGKFFLEKNARLMSFPFELTHKHKAKA